jgi:hypothetical protein
MYTIVETPQLSDGDETRRIRLRPCFTGRYFAGDDTEQAHSTRHRTTGNRERKGTAETRSPIHGTQRGVHP